MKRNRQTVGPYAMGVCSLALGSLVWGQVASSGSRSLADAVFQEHQALVAEWSAFWGQRPTPDSAKAWQVQHNAEIQTFHQNAQVLGSLSALHPMLYIDQVSIPDNCPQAKADYLMARADLENKFAYAHNLLVQNSGGSTNGAQMQQTAMAQFQGQYAAQIADLQLKAKNLPVAVSALPVPDTFVVPASASPQKVAFLTLRAQLAREQAQVWNQNLNADSATRNAAILQWNQQNEANFALLSQLAQNSMKPN